MITIVLGMHRSGTSVVAGILHFNKVSMGTYETFWPRPLPQNPKGFYENYDFRKINDIILQESDYNTKHYKTRIPIPEPSKNIRGKMIKIVRKYESKFKNWGWKDPRTCLTISNWIEVFKEVDLIEKVNIIFVSRKSLSVARSLKKRNAIPLLQGVNLWKIYTERAINFCESSNIPTLYLSFEKILKNPVSECEKIFKFLSQPFNKNIVSDFVEKKISTNSTGDFLDLPKDITDLENKIEKLILL